MIISATVVSVHERKKGFSGKAVTGGGQEFYFNHQNYRQPRVHLISAVESFRSHLVRTGPVQRSPTIPSESNKADPKPAMPSVDDILFFAVSDIPKKRLEEKGLVDPFRWCFGAEWEKLRAEWNASVN